jgi:hypothetical protein
LRSFAPLWPAGHLPRKEGDHAVIVAAPIAETVS